MTTKKYSDFFFATDLELDRNGYFSICKSCCQEIYTDYYNEEKDIARALLRTCRKLNVVYDEVIVDKTIETLKGLYEKGKAVDRVFSTGFDGSYNTRKVLRSLSDPGFCLLS